MTFRNLSQFQTNLTQAIFGWKGFKFVQMDGHSFSKGDDSSQIAFIIIALLKLFWGYEIFSQVSNVAHRPLNLFLFFRTSFGSKLFAKERRGTKRKRCTMYCWNSRYLINSLIFFFLAHLNTCTVQLCYHWSTSTNMVVM